MPCVRGSAHACTRPCSVDPRGNTMPVPVDPRGGPCPSPRAPRGRLSVPALQLNPRGTSGRPAGCDEFSRFLRGEEKKKIKIENVCSSPRYRHRAFHPARRRPCLAASPWAGRGGAGGGAALSPAAAGAEQSRGAGKRTPDRDPVPFSPILDCNYLICVEHVCDRVKLSTSTLPKRKHGFSEFSMNFTTDFKADRIPPFYKNK